MSKTLAASSIAVAAVVIAACSLVPNTRHPPDDMEKAQIFLEALKVRDEPRLEALTGRSWAKGALNADQEAFLFGRGPPAGRSAQTIARTPAVKIHLWRTRERGQAVVFVTYLDPALPPLERLKKPEDHFMVDLFSCRFVVSGDQWLFETDICYSEQDNPFNTEPYG